MGTGCGSHGCLGSALVSLCSSLSGGMAFALGTNLVLGAGGVGVGVAGSSCPRSSQLANGAGSFVSAHADIARAAATHVTATIWRAFGRPDVGGRRTRDLLGGPFSGTPRYPPHLIK